MLLWWGHKAHGEVADAVVDRVAAARARGHGPDRPALGPLLEDLQAPDGHPLLPALARGRRARAAVGRSTGRTRSCRPRPTGSSCRDEEMYGEPFLVPEPLETRADLVVRGRRGVPLGHDLAARRRRHLLLPPRPRDLSDLPRRQRSASVLRNAVHWAYNPADRWRDVHLAPNVPVEKAPEKITAEGAVAAQGRRGGLPVSDGNQRLLILGTGAIARHHAERFAPSARLRGRRGRRRQRRARPRLRRGLRHRQRLRQPRRGDRLGRLRRGDQLDAGRRPQGDDAGAGRRRASRCSARSRWR